MTPNHIMMSSTWSNNTPKSIVILKNKKSCRLKKEPMSLENQSRSTPMRWLSGLPDQLR